MATSVKAQGGLCLAIRYTKQTLLPGNPQCVCLFRSSLCGKKSHNWPPYHVDSKLILRSDVRNAPVSVSVGVFVFGPVDTEVDNDNKWFLTIEYSDKLCLV